MRSPERGAKKIHRRASADLFKLICAQSTDQKRTAFSSNRLWGSRRLNIDFLLASAVRSCRDLECDVKNGRSFSPKIRGGKRQIQIGNARDSKLLTFTFGVTYDVHFVGPINREGGRLIIIGPIPRLALADSSLVPRRFRSFTSIRLLV